MTLRTPRRRISPQTKRRCRAIKGFLRRALGSTSQPDLQITSSIAVNVTDIKHKIQGLEKQLNEVSKHCRDINCFENIPGDGLVDVPNELKDEISQKSISIQLDGIEPRDTNSRPSGRSSIKKLKECDSVPKEYERLSKMKPNDKVPKPYDETISRSKNKYRDINTNVTTNYLQHDYKSAYENCSTAHSTSSFHSLDQLREVYLNNPSYSGAAEDKRTRGKVHNEQKYFMENVINKRNIENYDHHYDEAPERNAKHRRSKRVSKQLDSDFIEDIIRRQYKPVKMFGRKVSDISQFSAPVCRDREFCQNNYKYLKNDTDPYICSNGPSQFTRYIHHSDHSDMRSVCDARLYNVNRNFRRKHRKIPANAYDSDVYDLVPVKEKSSPKTRRKYFEDNMPPSNFYKEVPPSPRSQRPRLNLKAQQYYSESEDIDNETNTNINFVPKHVKKLLESEKLDKMYLIQQIRQMANSNLDKWHNHPDTQREIGTMSSVQHTNINTEANTTAVDCSAKQLNDTNLSTNKTDKALREIKDILQNFLQDIKKESQSGESETNSNINEDKNDSQNNVQISQDNGDNFNNYKPVHFPVPPAPYLPPFVNTCCYPVMPMCPVNPLNCTTTANSCGMPSTGLPHNYVPNTNETNEYIACDPKNELADDTFQYETDELIKEIYKYVSRSPEFNKKQNQSAKDSADIRRNVNSFQTKVTSRSVGGSKVYKRCDANVGTPIHNNVSKSCEAIHSNMFTDTSSTVTNGSYSDTVLEKHSSKPTATQSTTISGSSELSEVKKNKFTKVMESLGLYRKNKKDVIEELDESESAMEVDALNKGSPFRQDITNYMMNEQEYYRPPPVPSHYEYRDYRQDYRPPFNPNHHYHHHGMQPPVQEYASHHPHYYSGQHPSAPPYSHAFEHGYSQMQPQGPLCLKEIEVKSIACQSERKLSFFRKMTKKVQQPMDTGRGDGIQRNCSTQTQVAQNKPGLFSWKNPQTKMIDKQLNPLTYGFNTQKKLAEGDTKMRNAMLKKMFYKKNPFSPRNLIIKTIMGKDKSSFGDAPSMFRPRLFV